MLVRAMEWTRQKPAFAIAVVRNVTVQRYLLDVQGETSKRKDIATSAHLEEQDYLVGDVELEWLQMVGRPAKGRLQKFKGSGSKCTKSWHSLVKHFTHFKVTRTLHGEACEWIRQEVEGISCTLNL